MSNYVRHSLSDVIRGAPRDAEKNEEGEAEGEHEDVCGKPANNRQNESESEI